MSMEQSKKFTMIDEAFICYNCGCEVQPLGYTARDHCPHCLHSLHLDNNPGDRASDCRGELVPIGVRKHKDSYKIIYRCKKCKQEKVNIAADDDDFDALLRLASAMG